jgi:hypothetical protein
VPTRLLSRMGTVRAAGRRGASWVHFGGTCCAHGVSSLPEHAGQRHIGFVCAFLGHSGHGCSCHPLIGLPGGPAARGALGSFAHFCCTRRADLAHPPAQPAGGDAIGFLRCCQHEGPARGWREEASLWRRRSHLRHPQARSTEGREAPGERMRRPRPDLPDRGIGPVHGV